MEIYLDLSFPDLCAEHNKMIVILTVVLVTGVSQSFSGTFQCHVCRQVLASCIVRCFQSF